MKRSLFLIFAVTALLCGCSRKNSFSKYSGVKNLKVGFIYIGKINDKGYTQAQDAGRRALERNGVKTMYVENVPESDICMVAIRELVQQGCNMIFATSYGFGEYVHKAATEYPDVKFAHCSGAKTTENVSCYFGRIYEARYLTGIVAGLKTTANRIGYVAAFPIPECIRGINAFTLGVKSVNPDAVVHVRWSNSWDNPEEDRYKAEELLMIGCDIVTQHLDSVSVHLAAQKKGAYSIGYNFPTPNVAPDSYLTSACFNWEVFILDEVQRYLEGTWESRFYWEGIDSGIVDIGQLSSLCNPGTKKAVENARRGIISGNLNIFSGPMSDMNQDLKLGDGDIMTLDEIWNMDWFVDGVKVVNY